MAGARIQLKRATASSWATNNPVLYAGEIGLETDTNKFKIGDGTTAYNSLSYFNGNLTGSSLNDLADVTIVSASNGDFLRWNGTAWINDAVNLSTDTVGNYMVDVAAGTGVTITHTPGEGSTASVAIGQDVATTASVTFAHVSADLTGDVTGNADTATALQTSRVIELTGDVTGSVSFDGTTNATITTTIEPNTVVLGTDTTGNYMTAVDAGVGVFITHTPGEGSTASVAIGQDVSTSSSVSFAHVTADLSGNVTGNLTGDVTGNADTASTLETARTISLAGDLSGSVSFDGSADVTITANVEPNSVALGTDTTGNYVNDVVAGTGVTVTHTPGEGSSASIAIGQDVSTSASVTFAQVTISGDLTVSGTTTTLNTENLLVEDNIVILNANVTGSPTTNAGIEVERGTSDNVSLRWNETNDSWEVTEDGTTYKNIAVGQDVETSSSVTFAHVSADLTGDVTGNASTATTLETARTISLAGDLSGSVSFNGSADVTITASVEPDSVALGTDTTGNYMTDVVAGTGVTVTHTPGEGSSASVAIGQDVATTASVTFAHVSADVTGDLTGNADTASTLETARAISLAGDLSGSASFDGSGDVTITATIQPNSVALGADTTGNYVADVVAGAAITVTHTPGEGSSASVALNASLNDLNDVVVGAPEEFQALAYDGAGWVPTYTPVVSYVRNAESTTITTGTAVYLFGGNGDHASVKRADNSSDATSAKTVGLMGATVASNNNGPVITRGYVDGFDLSMYSVGDVLWLGTNGGLTTTKPSAPQHLVFIGVVVRATINGIAYVAVQNGYELEELHDVKVSSVANKDVLMWNSASSIWVNEQINLGTDTVGDYVQNLVAGTGVTLSNNSGEGSTPTVAIGQDVSTSASVVFYNLETTHDLTVGRNLIVSGSVITENQTSLEIDDPFIYLNGSSSVSNVDLGIAGNYNDGTYAHSGIFRDATDGKWKFFDSYTPEPSNPIDTGHVSYSPAPVVAETFESTVTTGSAPFVVASTTEVTNLHAATSSSLHTARAISLAGDLSGSVSFDGSGDVTLTATVEPNSVALGTDTTGNYLVDLAEGTGVTIIHTPGEGSTASVSIGQAVGTSSSVTFAAVTAPLVGNASTASTLQTARAISLAGDLSGSASFDGSSDITITASVEPNSVALGTDTTGNYVNDVTAGTGVTVTHTPGEGSSPTIAIGQAVGTSSSVTFAAVTAPLVGNASTASTLQTARAISLAGDLSGSASFDGSQDVSITATVQPNSVALGTDTTGNYVSDVTAGTGVTVTHTPGEGSSPTIAIGQAVGTSASVQFAQLTTTGNVTIGGDLTVNGTTTTVNTETINLADNVIVLNSNETSAPSQNAGIEIERGTSTNVSLRWNETSDKWELTTDGSSYLDIATESYVDAQSIAALDDIGDVSITSASAGDFLKWNGSAWVNDPINLSSDTVGDYVSSLVAGTGVTLTNNSGEGATPTIAIGQAVSTSSSVTFAAVTAPLIGNASTATTLQTSRTIELTGDVTGSVSFNGGANASIAATIAPNSVALGTDTTGNYMSGVTAGTGITVTHTPGEGSSATVALNATLDDLSNVNAPTPSNGQFLKYVTASSAWLPADIPTINALDDIGDVTITSVASGDALVWSGSAWVNDRIVGGATVSASAPTGPDTGALWFDSDTAQTFVYYDSQWVEIGGPSNGATILINDTAPASPLEGQLWYESDTGATFVYYGGAWVEVGVTAVESLLNVIDNKGDLFVGSADNTVDNLTVGANNFVLMADSSQTLGVKWAASPTSVLTAKGDILAASAANTLARLGVGSNNQMLVADSAETTGLKWAASPTSVLTTTGDLLYASAANTLARVGIGATGQVLTVVGGVPTWNNVWEDDQTILAGQIFG